MKRRICGAVLLLVLLCAMTLPAAAAGTSLRLEGPETLPAEGESFTLRLTIQGNPGLCAAQYTLRYDRTLLTCTGASVGSVLKGTLAAVNPEAEDGVIAAAASVDPAKGDGSIGEFTFRVLKAGTVRFTLADVSLTDGENQALTLDLPSLTLSPAGSSAGETTAPAPRFTDVPEGYWSHAQIERAAELGLISGYADGSFHPGASVTRAQFVTMLWRLAGKPAAAAEPGFHGPCRLQQRLPRRHRLGGGEGHHHRRYGHGLPAGPGHRPPAGHGHPLPLQRRRQRDGEPADRRL